MEHFLTTYKVIVKEMSAV